MNDPRPLKLGLDSFSYHLHLGRHAFKPREPRPTMWLFEQAESLGLEGVQLDPLHHNSTEDEARMFGRAAAERGMFLEWGTGGFDPEKMRRQLHLAHLAGARVMRTFVAGSRPTPEQIQEWSGLAVQWFREVAPLAEELDVRIALENHGDFLAHELRAIIDGVGHPYIGVCLDLGNNTFMGEDVMTVVETLASVTHSVHLKDGLQTSDGWRDAALGEGTYPLAQAVEVIRRQAPTLTAMVEVPSPELGTQEETLANEQRNVEQSAAHARNALGLGTR